MDNTSIIDRILLEPEIDRIKQLDELYNKYASGDTSTEFHEELATFLDDCNTAYRKGNPILSDYCYDWVEEILRITCPDHERFDKVSTVINKGRKQALPHRMRSMDKIKEMNELFGWLTKYNITRDIEVIITPKYDGISLLVDESNGSAWTRGDGFEGEYVKYHFGHMKASKNIKSSNNFYSYGEAIISRKNFEKYDKLNGGDYENGRNMVSGKFNDLEPNVITISDIDYIRFGMAHKDDAYHLMDKSEQLDYLNSLGGVKVPYYKVVVHELTEQLFYDLFSDWNIDYEIDGLIVEINDHNIRNKIGFETGGKENPAFARAIKLAFEDVEDTICTHVTYQVSKQGNLSPVVHIEPTRLNGVTVRKLYGDNARWLAIYGVGKGTKLTVKRSGMVIPRITHVDGFEVIKAKEFSKICNKFLKEIEDGTFSDLSTRVREYFGINTNNNFVEPPEANCWNSTFVNLVTQGSYHTIQQQRMVAFFEIMKIKNVSDKTVEELWDKGYCTIEDILNLKPQDMEAWSGWGERKAQIFYESIHPNIVKVPLERVQHASGFFYGLGSKKLALVKHFDTIPTLEQLEAIEGFSTISAKVYLDGIKKFWDWIEPLPITIKTKTEEAEDNKKETKSDTLSGWAVVFTGFRDKDMEKRIVANGGEIKSGISSKTTHLVMAQKGSGTTKEKKAIDLGNKILTGVEMGEILDRAENKNSEFFN